MKMKKSLSILLAIVMIAMMITSLPITANAADVDTAGVGEDTLKSVGSAEELEAACNEINNGAGGTYTIDLTESFEGQVEITNKDAVVTVISSKGKTLTATKQSAVYVANGATVNLGDGNSELILSGNKVNIIHTANDEPGLVYILSGSTCNMDEKVTLKDRAGENYLGGGVTVQGGTFVMNGGTIQNCGINGGSVCYGGGVAVFNSGYFEMNGGTITGCYATTDYLNNDPNYVSGVGGGVFVTAGSVFNMNGGTISNCTATNYGGGIAVVSAIQTRKFTSKAVIKNGATISGNKAKGGAGVFISGSHFAVAEPIAMNAQLSETTSGGNDSTTGALEDTTPNSPGLYIRGGLITDNESTGTYVNESTKAYGLGGGVLVFGLEVTSQIYNAKIISNHADHGAGIASFYYWTKTDIDGCTITGNIAKRNGGGVYLARNSSGGKTSLKNTTITGNASGDRGAGVYYDANSNLYISGANVIQNNKYNGKLNNLNILSVNKPVYVDGALTGSQIGLSDPTLWDDGKEDAATDAVSTDKLTSGYKDNNSDVHPDQYFTSDHETWIVDRTKAEEIEVDDTTKGYRLYTAKRYPVTNNRGPATGYNEYIRLEAQKPGTGAITTAQDIFDELVYRYDSKGYPVGTNLSYKKEYNAPDGTTVTIEKKTLSTTIMFKKGSFSVTFTGNTTYQNRATDGILYLNTGTSSSNRGDINNYTFSTTPDDQLVEIKYYPAYLYSDFIYEYDDLGKVTAKLVFEGGRYNYTTVYGKKIATVGDDKEVRLVRKTTVDYHINNDYIAASHDNHDGTDKDIFTDEITKAGTSVNVGDMIKKFYTVPEVVPTAQNTCPYIFKGWYYDKDNNNDDNPVDFGSDIYTAGRDIYAHWITVEDNIARDADDPYSPNKYGGFDLAGVQIRRGVIDTNFGEQEMPGGMRFITSLSKKVVDEINALDDDTDIEYGYVAATDTNKGWINYHNANSHKLQYVSTSANGINTLNPEPESDETYFGFATNVNCTSQESNKSNSNSNYVAKDHRSYDGYLLYTLVVTYEGATVADKAKNILARPYIHYTDANGLERVAYSDYNGKSNKLGGCYTNYDSVVKISL